ncbi:MAG: hypothetical protein IAE80_18490 [Anaerolinea sp.]|nr:hypothetical protein [Anaerolinea sp.]
MKRLLLLCLFLIAFPLYAQEVTPEITDEPFPPPGWTELSAPGLSLLGRQANLQAVYALMQPVYDQMAASTGRQPEIKLLIIEDEVLPGCVLDAEGIAVVLPPIPEATPETCSPETIDLQGYEPIRAQAETVSRLTQALFERFYATGRMPAWFVSGMVDFFTPSNTLDRLSLTRDLVRASRTLPAERLEAGLEAPPDTRFAALPDSDLYNSRLQAYGMILFIIDRIGVDGLLGLASDGGDFDAAYEAHVGELLTALVPNWENWIFTRAAETAYGVTPYQAPTVAPTASNTATATSVPTLTPSPAPTFTATEVVTLTPSRAPTRTASWTPSPFPATRTPRPPGSPLIVATEVPVPAPPFQLPRFNIVVVLIIILVILVIVYVVLSYRK